MDYLELILEPLRYEQDLGDYDLETTHCTNCREPLTNENINEGETVCESCE